MKILIIVPRYVEKSFSYYNFPLGLGYIAAIAKRDGHKVVGLNLNETNDSIEIALEKAMAKENPDVIATGSLSGWIDQIKKIFTVCKVIKPELITIVGGGMLSGEPEPVMRTIDADYGVIGEGEETISELLTTIKEDKDKGLVKGLVFWDRKNNNLIRNAPREAILNLDTIPWPEYDLLEFPAILERQSPTDAYYFSTLKKPRVIDMVTSRSCPFSCTFCFHPAGKVYRERDLEEFFKELKFYKEKYNINSVAIVDELFSLKRKRLLEFCERMEPLNINWIVQLHVNSVDDETIKKMKSSGCNSISYGIESMDPLVLESMKKKAKVERVDQALALTDKEEIIIQGNLIFGDSVETVETANNTLKWWSKNRDKGVNLTPLQVWPGSPVYIEAVRNGLITDRDNYVKNLPVYLNVSNMNNVNMGILHKVLTTYTLTGFKWAKNFNFKVSKKELPNRGKSYDLEYDCPHCNTKNHNKNCIIDYDEVWPFIRMFCSGCYKRVNVEKPDWLNDDDIKNEQTILSHVNILEKELNYDEALKLLDLIISKGRRSSQKAFAWFKKSEILKKNGRLLDTFDCLIEAIKINPRVAEYHLLLADIYYRLGIIGGAIVLLENALSANPNLQAAKNFLTNIKKNYSDEERDLMFKSFSNAPPPQKKEHKKQNLKIRHKDKLMLANGRFDVEPEFAHLEPT